MDSLLGITLDKWWQLLRENRFEISHRYWAKAFHLTLISVLNHFYRRREEHLFKDEIKKIEITNPIFIIGHWRSGTTLLHSLLSLDDQFAYPNLFEVTHPNTCLVREKQLREAIQRGARRKRIMDNVEVTVDSPGEDEFAISTLCLRSPIIGWSFPRREEFYDRYLTFKKASDKEIEEWLQALIYFYQKITYKYHRSLLLKSPTHTARIRMLVDVFPDARFIHIHRNPYHVYQSTLKFYRTTLTHSYLQEPESHEFGTRIIERYKEMYDAYFEDRNLIRPDRLIELAYEELVEDFSAQIERIYKYLNLPGFSSVKPKLTEYFDDEIGFQANTYPELPKDIKNNIDTSWKRNFTEWDYQM